MSLVLVGYRGSGKTSVARKLADRLWWKFADGDEHVVKQAGATIAEIFAVRGEEGFRELESAALVELLGLQEHVLSLGGGVVIRPSNRELIQASGHRVGYLRCDAQVLAARIAADPSSAAMRRSLTALGGGVEEVRVKLAEREPLYREVAHFEVDVSHLSVDETVTYVARLM